MARLPRVVALGTPHHVTQRGNARGFILDSDPDRAVYLQLLRHYALLHGLRVLGYCLMSNHVHLVITPGRIDSLALALKYAHGRYAAYFNTRYLSSGHVWQGRYYSCPLDFKHLWAALRYTELNPVRAGLVERAEAYPWSSAAVHCGTAADNGLLDLAPWRELWQSEDWRDYQTGTDTSEAEAAIRSCTHSGRPLGGPEFVKKLEAELGRRLAPSKGGRPAKQPSDARQAVIAF